MPSPKISRAGAVVAFFRSAPLDVAELVLDMCRDAVREKKALAEKVKEGQQKAAKQREKEAAAKEAMRTGGTGGGTKKAAKKANGSGKARTRRPATPPDDPQAANVAAEALPPQ